MSEFVWPTPAFDAGMALLDGDDPALALEPLRVALAECRAHRAAGPAGECMFWIGAVLLAGERNEEAVPAFAGALALLDPAELPLMVADCAEQLAELGRPADAVAPLRAAVHRLGELGETEAEAEYSDSLALILTGLDDLAGAAAAFRVAAAAFGRTPRLTDAAESAMAAAGTAAELDDPGRVLADATAAADLFARAGDPDRADRCCSLIGCAQVLLGDPVAAEAAFHRARRGYTADGDTESITDCDDRLGRLYQESGRADDAVAAFDAAAAGYTAAGEHQEAARCYREVGSIHWAASRFEALAVTWGRMRDALAAAGDAGAAAEETKTVGQVWLGVGRTDRAIQEYERARGYYAGVADAVAVARCDLLIAGARWQDGEAATAESLHRACLVVFESAGAIGEQVDCLGGLGELRMLRGDLDEARRLHERALDLALAVAAEPDDERVAGCCLNLAQLAVTRSRTDEALRLARRAGEIYRRLGIGYKEANCRIVASSVLQLMDDHRAAEAELTAAQKLLQESGLAALAPMAGHSMVSVYLASGRPDDAAAVLRRAEDRTSTRGTELQQVLIEASRAGVELRSGDYVAAAERAAAVEQRLRAAGLAIDATTMATYRGVAVLLQGRTDEGVLILRQARAQLPSGDGAQAFWFNAIDRMLGAAEMQRGDHEAALALLGSARRQSELAGASLELAKLDVIIAYVRSLMSGPDQLAAVLDLALPAVVFIDAQRFRFARASSRSQWYRIHGLQQTVVLYWAARSGDATLVADLVEVMINSGCHVSTAPGADTDYLTAMAMPELPGSDASEPPGSDASGPEPPARSAGGAARLIASATLPMLPPPRLRMPDGRRALSPYVEAADARYREIARPPDISAV